MAIAPYHGDQPSSAENLVTSGAGCVVKDQSRHSLRRAIEQITSDDGMRINACKSADEIASMGSIENALDKLFLPYQTLDMTYGSAEPHSGHRQLLASK
jgi:UDP:flavonoid glycosyltransferase YjiC (YdhE family)